MAWGGVGGGANFQQLTSDIIGHFKSKKDARKAEQLYRKRYQTMVNDLRAAGLNPMLAYGGMAGGAFPQFPEVQGRGSGGVEVAPAMERERMKAQTELDRSAAARQRQDEATGQEQERLVRQERITSSAQQKRLEVEAVLGAAQAAESNARTQLHASDLISRRLALERQKVYAVPFQILNRLAEIVTGSARKAAQMLPRVDPEQVKRRTRSRERGTPQGGRGTRQSMSNE